MFKKFSSLIYLDTLEKFQIDSEIDKINSLNDAVGFHDVFRTSKREIDEYLLDVIYSKKECDQWIYDNEESIWVMDKSLLDKFWETYPDGVIDFG